MIALALFLSSRLTEYECCSISEFLSPTCISLPERYVSEDDQLVLSCHVMGYPQPKITWLKDADRLPASPRFQTSITEEGICECNGERRTEVHCLSLFTFVILNYECISKDDSGSSSYLLA